jgi:hypothetical protein
VASQSQKQRRNTCICNWIDCYNCNRAFKKKLAGDGDEGDNPWGGGLKQIKISESVKSKAFCYAIEYHLGTAIASLARKFYVAPHHFARAALKIFPQLQTRMTKEQVRRLTRPSMV